VFRVPGFGFRVSGFGFRVSGFGFRVSGVKRGPWSGMRGEEFHIETLIIYKLVQRNLLHRTILISNIKVNV